MITAIIIDDEPDCVQSLEQDIKAHCKEVEIVAACVGAKEGIRAINKFKPDVIFLDIEMPIIDGFELLELVSNIDFEVIFTTAYDKFALKALKISAIDYLLKPIKLEELKKAVHKVLTKSETISSQKQINFLFEHLKEIKSDSVSKIILPTFEGLNFVKLQDILYCNSDGAYSHVHLTNGSKITISKTLRYLEEILCDFHFYRVHNSHIVNLNYIVKYSRKEGGYLIMKDEVKIRVSRSKKDELLSLF